MRAPPSFAEQLEVTAAAIVADATERATSLRAMAARIREGHDEDERISMADAARIAGIEGREPARTMRAIAEREGLEIERAGRSPVIRRAALEAWLASRCVRTTRIVADDTREAARAAVARTAARIRGAA